MEKEIEIEDIRCCTQKDAEELLTKMSEILYKYNVLRVSDVYDLIGKTSSYVDSLYVWTTIEDMFMVYRPNDEWVIDMPKAKHVDFLTGIRKDDMVDHPNHYQSEKGIEVIDVMEAFTSELEGIEAVDTAQVLKYICRWKKKNGLQDLNKAMWYLNHLINHVKNKEKENEQ